MLGLRKISHGFRSRHSLASSTSSKKSFDEMTLDAQMGVHANGSQGSLNTETSKQVVQTTENGTTNPSKANGTKHWFTRAIEAAKTVKIRLVNEVEDVDESHFERVDLQTYLEYIEEERLMHMPKRGSQWDHVLKEAEFFGLQLNEFAAAVEPFISGSREIRDTALASCYLLLELGHDQGDALEPTFNALYELAQLLGQALRMRGVFTSTETIARGVGEIYVSLVKLVGDIAVYYRQRVNRLLKGTVSIDFDAEFGLQIERIWARREDLFNSIWSYKLGRRYSNAEFASIHRNLGFSSHQWQTRVYGRTLARKGRSEGTCEWMEGDLIDFLNSDDDIFTITGNAGCGKSVLATWVRERLERPVGHSHRKYETIRFSFAGDNPVELTSVAFLKSLLSQLLDIDVGDANLLSQLSGLSQKSAANNDSTKLENELWKTFDHCLKSVDERGVGLAIIVEGFDEIIGGAQRASELYKRLHQSVSKLPLIRAITFSRPISHLGNTGCRHLVITPDYVRDDIKMYLEDHLFQWDAFKAQSGQKQQALLNTIVNRAKGSFLFAYLAVQILSSSITFDSYQKTLESVKSDPSGPFNEVFRLIDLKDNNVLRLLTFMAVSQRPFSIEEMETLLSVDLAKKQLLPPVDVRKLIRQTRGLVIEHQGMIRFKHSVIRKCVIDVCGSKLVTLKDAHQQLTMTMLFLAKSEIDHPCEPSLDSLSATTVEQTFHSYRLIEYIVRNWVVHFKLSSLYGSKGNVTLTKDFKDVFPDSVLFTMLEWTTWENHTSLIEAIGTHELALNIRIACFGEKHKAVLQGLIILGGLYRARSDLDKAAEYFYRASCVGQVVLYKFSPLVISCTNTFLSCTEKHTFTKRTTLFTYREQMMRFMIEVFKGKHGPHSDIVIQWYEALAKLYVSIHEEYMAATIYKELHEIVLVRHGRGSSKERDITQKLSGMKVVLHGENSQKEIVQSDEFLFEASEEMDITDDLRVSIILSLAKSYEAQGKLYISERLFISLWRRVSEAVRLKASVDLCLVQINIALEYIEFLRRTKRTDEAANVTVCLLGDYEHTQYESKTIILRLKEVALLARSFGMLTVSASILQRVWAWFKTKNEVDSEQGLSTTVLITEIVQEITETTTETVTTTTTTETLTREVFETTLNRCRKVGKVDSSFFRASIAMVNTFFNLRKWSEAETVLRQSLELSWNSVLSVDGKITLEGSYISEKITTATRLAMCYRHQEFHEQAERLYVRLFEACIGSLQAEDSRLIEIVTTLVSFHEEYHQHQKVIDIYTQLLQYYRKQLGNHHEKTIHILKSLAAVYAMLGRREAFDCYKEVVTIYTKDGRCRHEAFEAAKMLVKFYRREQRWSELQSLCAILWTTIKHHEKGEVITEEFVQIVYEQYRFVLEFHAKAEFSVLYRLSVEYRDTVKKIFSSSASIIVLAMIALAEICETNESHYDESITLYEEVITRTTTVTTVTTTKVHTIKKRLSQLYVTVIEKGRKTDKATVERGILLCFEAYEQLKVELSWWHETTLLKLRELVILHSKVGTKKSQSVILELLQESVIKIITSTTSATDLYRSAITLASIYKTVGFTRQGFDLLRQLQHLILFPGFDGDQKPSIKLEIKVKRVVYVFLISFEQTLTSNEKQTAVGGFSQVLADLMMEALLYEQYAIATKSITETTNFEVVLEHSARLRCIWVNRGRSTFVTVLDKKLFALFTSRYAKNLGSSGNPHAAFAFYVALLSEIGNGVYSERASIDFASAACKAINNSVRELLVEKNDMAAALAVGECGFNFASTQKYYQHRECAILGYHLAGLLAGHGVTSWKSADASLQEKMLVTSRNVLQSVLAALREGGIDFVSLKFEDLSNLVKLLGEQRNYIELENILSALWQSREVQRGWSTDVVLCIGSLLVDAHALAGHDDAAIILCDTLYYNVRQSRSRVDEDALGFAKRLTHLLKRAGRAGDASRIHAEVLRDLDDFQDGHVHDERLRAVADAHLEGMRLCGNAVRTDGIRTARELYGRLGKYGKLNVSPVEQWKLSEPAPVNKTYEGPSEWSIRVENTEKRSKKKGRDSILPAQIRWGYWTTQGSNKGIAV